MVIRFLLLFFNVFILYSHYLYYSGFDFKHLNLGQKFSLRDKVSFSENYAYFGNKVFIKFQFDDDFLYKRIQENEDLNIEKTIGSNWGRKVFRFSAINVGTFPIVFFISLFCFDFFSPFSNNFMVPKNENFNRFVISTSIGLAISLIIALIDTLIYY
ncbi:hypothetical protein BmHG_00022 [Borrelia miyamotoi]|uniref:Uncharacterized protein n=1 Tax=Borrelia miyamotoi TaxID=47466 RepID=A0AAP8YWV3_9SPIR|nr:hypothetical protein [Borrelia miyamotoi]AHH05397.1 Hypothetical protein BOM_0854 [Borrelia miyamotoi FR64b]ATQ15154.1 hypothetical protein CNO14_04160 [Borrelia miyamotoi]ATQ16336.1 hypothetical protein CNO13_04160 [Borrelia miyamotoi]ATQ18018.1 hypothetical protein CNO11_00090 [Borrelia miyamotoi]ATQ19976.1 hypothetical protein CNO10_04165 [Borrelia miyamotoi]